MRMLVEQVRLHADGSAVLVLTVSDGRPEVDKYYRDEVRVPNAPTGLHMLLGMTVTNMVGYLYLGSHQLQGMAPDKTTVFVNSIDLGHALEAEWAHQRSIVARPEPEPEPSPAAVYEPGEWVCGDLDCVTCYDSWEDER